MEKISCAVVRDLLPLYIDGAASGDTAALVEDHLRSCDACRREARLMQEALSLPPDRDDEPLRRLRRTIRRRTAAAVALTMLACYGAGTQLHYLFIPVGLALGGCVLQEALSRRAGRWRYVPGAVLGVMLLACLVLWLGGGASPSAAAENRAFAGFVSLHLAAGGLGCAVGAVLARRR